MAGFASKIQSLARDIHAAATGLGARQKQQHAELEARFEDLQRRARAGDWKDLNEVWSDFCADYEAHMTLEEDDLFPAYLRAHPEDQEEVNRLRKEHEEIRKLFDTIAVEIQLHEIRAETIDRFVARNRGHAAREARRFYAWADTFAA